MDDEVREYVQYLCRLLEISKPLMPKFDLTAYTDNEYLSAISSVQNDYEAVDDLWLTLEFLKGD